MKVAVLSVYPAYVITDTGRIQGPRSWLKPTTTQKGYQRVTIHAGGRQTSQFVHVLVCTAFHGDRPTARHQVRHRNGVGSDNRAVNLCWGTPEENWSDRVDHGNGISGEKCYLAKLTWEDVRAIRNDYAEGAYSSHREAASSYGISRTAVTKILNNQTWKETR